jgi:hypothetical protein
VTTQEKKFSACRSVRFERLGSARTLSLRYVVTASLALIQLPAHALTIEHSRATYVDKHYEYEMVALIDAPVERVEAVLRDYEAYTKLDPRILEAHVLERPESYVATLETTVRVCLGPFCRNVRRIERVEESPLELSATADPARSDVRFGETRMMLSTTEGRTRVSYRTSIVPDFWIPPFAGRRWLLATLEDATTELFRNVEAKAKADADAGTDPGTNTDIDTGA